MWPHSLTLLVHDTVVAVGTDDPTVAALLQPWRTDLPHPGPADFGLALHPPAPMGRGEPRALPTLQHGTRVLGRSADPDALVDGLLRTLATATATATATAPAGVLWLSGLPLVRDGQLAIAAANTLDRTSARALARLGWQPLFVPAVLVDPAALTATVPAPLGDGRRPLTLPLGGWWLDGELPARADVARTVAHAAPLLAGAWHADAGLSVGSDELGALVALVQRLPPWPGRVGQ